MKINMLIYGLLISLFSFTDKNKRKYDDGYFLYEFHIAENNDKVDLQRGIQFYWYDYDKIKSSIYGIKGKVLNGSYVKSILETNMIIEEGKFVYGKKEGNWKKWDSQGNLERVEFWKEGLRNGLCEIYNEEGKVSLRGSYDKGVKTGKWENNFNKTKIIRTWKRGVLNGGYKEYENEVLIKKGRYRKGEKEGLWIDFKAKSRKKYKKGKLINANVETFWERLFEEPKDSI
ncbi:hypothetical protein R5N98_03870 [Tenacibaculum maritimum]|uniref:toxin-antitoxin system YwqK family antitoxin n=1 Tax=Tenacibaculum maritimum TaxID=107401 RepID=UPI0038776CA2